VAGTVLIVDDDPSVVDALRLVMPPEVEIASAADAAGAMALLDSRKFCGLVLDLVLETGSGFDVLRHMETQKLSIPTVVITTKLPTYLREMLHQNQVKLVFPKPIEPRLLAAVVLGLCGMS
jgi:DNA-binding NtrC family response regulator